MFPISNTQYRTNNKMKSYLVILFCLCMMLLISDASRSDEVASLLTAFKARLLERRPEGDTTVATDKNRKMIEVRDPSSIVDGKYIIIFDPDSVANATDKSMQLFTKSQISYIYDNIAIKGVAIRNVTTQRLHEVESDQDILSIEPVSPSCFTLNNILLSHSRSFYLMTCISGNCFAIRYE